MFESPVDIFYCQVADSIDHDIEDCVYKTALNMGISVKKEQLMKALFDARSYYDQGFRDGYEAASIVYHNDSQVNDAPTDCLNESS